MSFRINKREKQNSETRSQKSRDQWRVSSGPGLGVGDREEAKQNIRLEETNPTSPLESACASSGDALDHSAWDKLSSAVVRADN
jgi:hypothetical protein